MNEFLRLCEEVNRYTYEYSNGNYDDTERFHIQKKRDKARVALADFVMKEWYKPLDD